MGKSRARTLAPRGTAQWVTWKTTETTRGLKGKWCPVKPSQPSPSVQSSPAKSPRKHNSDRAWDQSSTDFNADYEDFGNKEPIGALNLPLGRKKTKSPNDYLREWKFRTDDYLRILHE
ncbi:uncharacterized protein F5891DRAFT_1196457 [Suillus fuscotomentosus]|uniref:Uncharacterized protein n=1 Tax=Suillus fuscotomentosus TaxID=1912939 RepID=A0AAD4HEN9_9AGAM|nr:uncharacterized protein F5891DRAFT_1196457 [Suillus fuscotomentosus]KAG1893411.1 hypothetical protein F5891DRAFT_1196457 [Suillus fuscotomentosus]